MSLIQVLIRVIVFSLDDEFSKKKIKFLKFNFEIDENSNTNKTCNSSRWTRKLQNRL